mmetsp:Transcript_46396/g.145543  ORF Transcript_46396/g.145543 Transcript_46396/m.145543 type:complete len:152 (+) Transcript_46396:1-456(+)
MIASGSHDNTVRIWEVQGGRQMSCCEGHTHVVTSVSWSGDARMIASSSWDKTLRIWEVVTGKRIWYLRGHASGVSCVSWSWNGRVIASGSWDRTIKIWQGILWVRSPKRVSINWREWLSKKRRRGRAGSDNEDGDAEEMKGQLQSGKRMRA